MTVLRPGSSSQRRSKPMKLRNRLVSGFQACWRNAAKRLVKESGRGGSPGAAERTGEQQRPGIVVGAIAVRAIRHAMHAHAAAGRYHRTRTENGRSAWPGGLMVAGGRAHPGCAIVAGRLVTPALSKRAQVTLGYSRPYHRPAVGVGALAHRLSPGSSLSNPAISRPSAVASPKGTRMPRPSGQQFPCVPIGRRDHRLAQPEAVGQRAGCHLRLIEIGRGVDIAHRDERSSVAWSTNRSRKTTWSSIPSARTRAIRPLPIGLALITDEIRMGRSEHDIDGRGAALQDSGIASIITSMPLLGESSPKVRMTGRPAKPRAPSPRRARRMRNRESHAE